MQILALDLSTKSSGWAVIDDQTSKIIEYGCISSTSTSPERRISYMKDELLAIFDRYPIGKIVAEEVPNVPNTSTYKLLTWLQGCIKIAIYEKDKTMKFEYLYPSAWRATLGIPTGRGIKRSQEKEYDMQYVNEHFGIKANDDICDAICIGIASIKKSDCAWTK